MFSAAPCCQAADLSLHNRYLSNIYDIHVFQSDGIVNEELSGITVNKAPVPTAVSLTIVERFLALEQRLCDVLQGMQFPAAVTHIYNPLEYAIVPHRQYVNTYCTTTKDVLFLGINPGPFGMAQTGVTFIQINSDSFLFNQINSEFTRIHSNSFEFLQRVSKACYAQCSSSYSKYVRLSIHLSV